MSNQQEDYDHRMAQARARVEEGLMQEITVLRELVKDLISTIRDLTTTGRE